MIALDTETTGTNVRKDRVIGFSYFDGTESQYITHLAWNGKELVEVVPKAKCIEILSSFSDIIFHNAAFDIQIIKNYFGVDLSAKTIADTMLMAHLCDENRLSYGLKELGRDVLGIPADEQAELKQWLKDNKTKDFYRAPTHLLAKYAKKDVELTLKLYQKLAPNCPELLKTEVMPMWLNVVIPMMARGLAINVSEMSRDRQEITEELEKLERKIQSQIRPLLGTFLDWFYEKNYPFKTRGKMATLKKNNPALSDRDVQRIAFKTDGGLYEFNISSKDHLKRLFFDTLKATPLSFTDSGAPQVDSDFLATRSEEWTKLLIVYNKLSKIKSTYIDRILEEQENGIWYPSYYMHRTTSGRLSGDAQQLPRPISGDDLAAKYTSKIRAYFVSRPGYCFLGTDYNSLEPRIFAALAGDEALLNIFRNNQDFYSTIAIAVEKLSQYSPDKNAENYLGTAAKDVRQRAKAYSLGIRYGLDDYKLHKDLNISQNEAKRLINGYFAAFPKLKQSMDDARRELVTSGTIATQFGRIRRAPDAPKLYIKHGSAIFNALDLWKKYNDPEPNSALYSIAKQDYKRFRAAQNNFYNFPIQATAAHVTNRACIAIAKAFRESQIDAHIVAQIHDEIIVECAESVSLEVAKTIQTLMENTSKFEIALDAEPAKGYNLKEAK